MVRCGAAEVSYDMKRMVRMVLMAGVIELSGLTPAAPAMAECPDDMVELRCQGEPNCEPAGAFCCGDNACARDQVCLQCEDNAFCAPSGSTCCAGRFCPPGQECTTCGTSTQCRPRGEDCPLGDMD